MKKAKKKREVKKEFGILVLVAVVLLVATVAMFFAYTKKEKEQENKKKVVKVKEDDVIHDITYSYYSSLDTSRYQLMDDVLYEVQGFKEGNKLTNGNGVTYGKFEGDTLKIWVNYDDVMFGLETQEEEDKVAKEYKVWKKVDEKTYELQDAKDPEDLPYLKMTLQGNVLLNLNSWYYKDKTGTIYYHSYEKTKSGKPSITQMAASANDDWVVVSEDPYFALAKEKDKNGEYWVPDLPEIEE